MRYTVTHITTYAYDKEVTNSFGIAYVRPRELDSQRILSSRVDVVPEAEDLSTDIDFYGNQVTYFHVTEEHERLEITAVTDVEVETPVYDESTFAQAWERARPLASPDLPGAWRAADLAVR
ncbi:MAG: transglutaminase family protein, partial [Nocardioides sp.]|nr:transglutaminase family protein [Nocardioides sp.]